MADPAQRPSVSHNGSFNTSTAATQSVAQAPSGPQVSSSTPGTPSLVQPRIENRRRGSSFGFGSSFFSSLTNTLRPSSSSSNLAVNSPGRSRAGSSSRLNLGHNSNNSTPSVHRTQSQAIPIVHTQPHAASATQLDTMSDLYAATPTDDNLQGQTRSNSLMGLTRQKPDSDGTYSIRLTPFIDHSTTTQGLYFSPILRKTKPGSRLAIGRYTDKVRDAAQAPPGSDAPVVFKSKVVSRTHAEFYVDVNGNWFIKDLKSSSGTFLNHVRLSPAGVESADTPIENGDVLQLGMDFRGGVEDIFRCVKMRVETNKSWQRKAKQFNKQAHERLKALALVDESELAECAICLLKVKPCQSVFISPCSHCWHYKCIRPIVVKSYPQFLCPNCRETCDLEADLDEDESATEAEDEDELLKADEDLQNRRSTSTTDDEQLMMEALTEESI